jgi:hypothetical protein
VLGKKLLRSFYIFFILNFFVFINPNLGFYASANDQTNVPYTLDNLTFLPGTHVFIPGTNLIYIYFTMPSYIPYVYNAGPVGTITYSNSSGFSKTEKCYFSGLREKEIDCELPLSRDLAGGKYNLYIQLIPDANGFVSKMNFLNAITILTKDYQENSPIQTAPPAVSTPSPTPTSTNIINQFDNSECTQIDFNQINSSKPLNCVSVKNQGGLGILGNYFAREDGNFTLFGQRNASCRARFDGLSKPQSAPQKNAYMWFNFKFDKNGFEQEDFSYSNYWKKSNYVRVSLTCGKTSWVHVFPFGN